MLFKHGKLLSALTCIQDVNTALGKTMAIENINSLELRIPQGIPILSRFQPPQVPIDANPPLAWHELPENEIPRSPPMSHSSQTFSDGL